MATILVIEDDESIGEVISIILEGERHQVIIDRLGSSIFKGNTLKKVDLVLVDYLLPQATGAEIINFIRVHEKLLDLPIILMSANSEKQIAKIAKNLSVEAYLPKPFDIENLTSMVNSLLSKN